MKRIPVGKWSVSTVINDESYQSGTRQDSWHPGKATVSRAGLQSNAGGRQIRPFFLHFCLILSKSRRDVSCTPVSRGCCIPCAAALPGPIRKAWAISTQPVDAAAAAAAGGSAAHAHWPVAGWHVGARVVSRHASRQCRFPWAQNQDQLLRLHLQQLGFIASS